jgi:hypothetical protein
MVCPVLYLTPIPLATGCASSPPPRALGFDRRSTPGAGHEARTHEVPFTDLDGDGRLELTGSGARRGRP